MFFFPLIALWSIHYKQVIISNPLKEISYAKEIYNIKKIIICSIPIYIVACLTIFQNDSFLFQDQHPDFLFYVDFADGILKTGNENIFRESNVFFPELFSGCSPYHYFELWLNVIVNEVFGYSSLVSLCVVTYPILQVVCLIGVIELLGKQLKFRYLLVISFLFLFIEPIYFSFYETNELLKYYSGYVYTSVNLGAGRKLAPVLIFLILFLKLFLENYKKESFYVLAALPVVSVGTLPGIEMGLFCYILLLAIRERSLAKYIHLLMFIAIFSISYLLFYKINTIEILKSEIEGKNIISVVLREGLNWTIFKSFIFKFVFPFVRLLVYTLPYFLLLLLGTKKSDIVSHYKSETFEFSLLTFFILLSGAFSVSLAYELTDSGQLLCNLIPILTLWFIMIFSKWLSDKRKYVFLFILFLLNIYNAQFNYFQGRVNTEFFTKKYRQNLSDSFKHACVEEVQKIKKPRVAYLYENSKMAIEPRFELYYSPALFLEFSNENPESVCINNPKYINKSDKPEYFSFLWPLYIYSLDKKEMEYPELVEGFCKTYDFDFLLLEGNEVPPFLNGEIQLLEKDRATEYSFYKFIK
jgi:hypothetical protein